MLGRSYSGFSYYDMKCLEDVLPQSAEFPEKLQLSIKATEYMGFLQAA